MGGLANFIERAGVATTSISLIREHSEAVGPPRALWVPFPLGRPLGVAGDNAFQPGITCRAQLVGDGDFTRNRGLSRRGSEHGRARRMGLSGQLRAAQAPTLEQRLRMEIARLNPWAEETRRARGRTLIGASGGSTETLDAIAAVLAYVADGGDVHQLPKTDGDGQPIDVAWWHTMPFLLRHLAEDLRIHYQEAVAAQPGGGQPTHRELTQWIFSQTVLGETLTKVGETITATGERRLLTLRGHIIPEGFVAGDESFGRRQPGDPPGFQRAVAGNRYLRGEGD